MRTLTTAVLVILAFTMLSGCKSKREYKMPPSNSNNTKLWHKFDTPPGADPSVPDSLGGEGFDKIAEKMGFVTYVPKEEELKYFGDPRAVKGGEFRIISDQFPATFRPEGQNSTTVYNNDVKSVVYETLLGEHPLTRQWLPALASHWKISDDKLTFTYRINPNARFSDGKPVTAADVVASFKLMMDETILEPSSQLVYSKFETPVALSKYIVQVKAKSLNFRNFLYFSGALLIQPAHEIGLLTGREYLEKYNQLMPAGSGPYILLTQDIKDGVQYVLTRRADYWDGENPLSKYTGNFDRIVYEVVKDNPTLQYEKFKSGEGDAFRFSMATTEKWMKDVEYDALKHGWVKRMRVLNSAPMGTQGYAFNMRREPWNDIRVRRAFAHLLPRKQMIEKLLFNEYTPFDTEYPNSVYENPNNEKMEYNPEMASKLLDEAGWSQRNGQGIRVKNGRTLNFELATTKARERFVTPYQQELRKAGIDMQIKFEDWPTTIKNIDARNFDIFGFGYGGLLTPNPETSIHSSLADKKDNNNIQGVKDPRLDALCDQYDKAFDIKEQIRIIREIDGICASMHYNVHEWNPRGIRFAYWDKFGMPEYVLPRYAMLSYLYRYISMTWWYDPDKVSAIDQAKTKKADVDGPKTIQENSFWKSIQD